MKKNTLKQTRAGKALTIFLIAAAVAGNSAKRVETHVTETTVTVEVIR
jgi:hypothetical protein